MGQNSPIRIQGVAACDTVEDLSDYYSPFNLRFGSDAEPVVRLSLQEMSVPGAVGEKTGTFVQIRLGSRTGRIRSMVLIIKGDREGSPRSDGAMAVLCVDAVPVVAVQDFGWTESEIERGPSGRKVVLETLRYSEEGEHRLVELHPGKAVGVILAGGVEFGVDEDHCLCFVRWSANGASSSVG